MWAKPSRQTFISCRRLQASPLGQCDCNVPLSFGNIADAQVAAMAAGHGQQLQQLIDEDRGWFTL
jgi:hypothetical protein